MPKRISLLLPFVAVACSGQVDGARRGDEELPNEASAPNAPTASAPPSEPLSPTDLASLCKKDAPHPRRFLRLSGPEIAASIEAAFPVDALAVPDGLLSSGITKADESLVVSRNFVEDIAQLATSLAAKLPTAKGSALSCEAASFGKDATCTVAFLQSATKRLYRGRADSGDVSALEALAQTVADRSGGERAFELVTRAMLMSPKFLYLSEGVDGVSNAAAPPAAMSPAELAAFFSYRITGGPPSAELLSAAEQIHPPTLQSLHDLLKAQFAEAELSRAVAGFLGTWLGASGIAQLQRDSTKHPTADASFMRRLALETEAQLNAFGRRADGTLKHLLTDSMTSSVASDETSPLHSSIGRPGVFALPGVLAAMSSSDHTNIPRRGRLLLRNLFCEDTPVPPADALAMQPSLRDGASQRERFENVATVPACRGCHLPINHLAYPFEVYDEVGSQREKDEYGNLLDPSGRLELSSGAAIEFRDVQDLMQQAASSSQVEACLAIQAFRQVARRGERGAADACLVNDLFKSAGTSGYVISDLVRDALARSAVALRAD